ncbi:hypothetical protein AOB46_17735 [Chryseobacterium indologenes]|uniref:MORN repeat variant n=2 Tax=Chryseobacterium indologenes TaxID=253 RepID=A0A0N1KT54_CHRID|nr:hypothetical protein AOB46_17735 [Chryseobacterium indologenes]
MNKNSGLQQRSMNFKITNGKGLVSVEYDIHHQSECLSIGMNPAVFLWDDCDDPGDENLVLFPINEENKNLINHALEGIDFEVDYTEREEDLFQILQPLLILLQNGNYQLSFSTNKTWNVYSNAAVFGDERLDQGDVKEEIKKYDEKLLQNLIYDYNAYGSYTNAHGFYRYEYPFIAWKSKEEINIDLVKQYESLILSGARPFAIILTGKYLEKDYFHDYILDGHHKLCAYKNLKMEPLFAVIEFLPESESEIRQDIERISQLMYPWQFSHYFNTWGKHHIQHYLKTNPDTLLKRYSKNGKIMILYPDNIKNAEGSYINNVADGEYKSWYKNGRLHSQGNYSLGKRTGKWTYYYDKNKTGNESADVDQENTKEEYIYKDGNMLVHKSWNDEGKITDIKYIPHINRDSSPLTDDLILKYSTERYRNLIRDKDVRERKILSENDQKETLLSQAKRKEKLFNWLKLLLLAVVLVLVIVYFL